MIRAIYMHCGFNTHHNNTNANLLSFNYSIRNPRTLQRTLIPRNVVVVFCLLHNKVSLYMPISSYLTIKPRGLCAHFFRYKLELLFIYFPNNNKPIVKQ